MVWGIFSWHTLGPLVPIEHRLNATAYLSIVADHVHPFMTTVYSSSDDYFQQDIAQYHKAQIISDWFLEHDNELTLLKWPPQLPDLRFSMGFRSDEFAGQSNPVTPWSLNQLLAVWAGAKSCWKMKSASP